jgi:uncharacterized protein
MVPGPPFRSLSMSKVFLTAVWRHLAMINYEVSPDRLLPLVPAGTEIDSWQGKTFVSLVGFQFLRTKIFGVAPIPMHINFEEVNLRFYVRRREGGELRRGVVFIREFVPRWAIATVARRFYNENYIALPMSHEIRSSDDGMQVTYSWQINGKWNRITLEAFGQARLPAEGSIEQFITEHYWGYTVQPDGGSVEYRVVHPSWPVWQARKFCFEGDSENCYGKVLAALLKGTPHSAFLAEGSPVSVLRGRRI